MYRIPSRFASRYYHVGLFTIVLFVIMIVSDTGSGYLSAIHPYFDYIFDAFFLTAIIYRMFEIHNIRADRRSDDDVYYFDENGAYRENHLVADWPEVALVTVVSEMVVNKISNDSPPGDDRLVTQRSLNNVMRRYGISSVDVRLRTSRIEIGKFESHRTGPDLTVYTTHFKPLLSYTYNRMRKLASYRSSEVNFRIIRE